MKEVEYFIRQLKNSDDDNLTERVEREIKLAGRSLSTLADKMMLVSKFAKFSGKILRTKAPEIKTSLSKIFGLTLRETGNLLDSLSNEEKEELQSVINEFKKIKI
jgi:hypothetical protein